MTAFNEPIIVINGEPMSTGAAMTLRVALESFAMDLGERGLGKDDHGLRMTKGYLDQIRVIRIAMFKNQPPL